MNALIPAVHAVMTRRILVNFRVRPEAAAAVLPRPFRPKLVNGWAMGGICLIRLEQMRPAWFPLATGTSSENAAHRIAVEWTEHDCVREGVYIPRRDTDSFLNRVAGGRLFPGIHHPATFRCVQNCTRFEVELHSRDGGNHVEIAAHLSESWPSNSVFASLDEASAFFRNGGCGWSPDGREDFEGVQLCTETWAMQPLIVERVHSTFFANPIQFPSGAVEFDSALLMNGIGHEWRALGRFGHVVATRTHNHRHGSSALFHLP
ncbi:MAG TPA: hypothetical protein VLU94_02730 [Candidatus Nitrosotalea sp.]|nr:hypothetical protein [Candidatus Nitrosotalea sp.]